MEDLNKEEAENLIFETINYILENDEDVEICEKEIIKVFKNGIFVNLIRLYKEKLMYIVFYYLYYLKTLGDTYYYEDIFDKAFESVDFEIKVFKVLKEVLKKIKEDKEYGKLFLFYEVIQELLVLDSNRSKVLIQDLNDFNRTIEGSFYSVAYPCYPINREMKRKVLEKVKLLDSNLDERKI